MKNEVHDFFRSNNSLGTFIFLSWLMFFYCLNIFINKNDNSSSIYVYTPNLKKKTVQVLLFIIEIWFFTKPVQFLINKSNLSVSSVIEINSYWILIMQALMGFLYFPVYRCTGLCISLTNLKTEETWNLKQTFLLSLSKNFFV